VDDFELIMNGELDACAIFLTHPSSTHSLCDPSLRDP